MDNLILSIKKNAFIIFLCMGITLFYVYLTYSGNQLCDCEKTEIVSENSGTRSFIHHTGRGTQRFQHK
jgi:hypothetical protein